MTCLMSGRLTGETIFCLENGWHDIMTVLFPFFILTIPFPVKEPSEWSDNIKNPRLERGPIINGFYWWTSDPPHHPSWNKSQSPTSRDTIFVGVVDTIGGRRSSSVHYSSLVRGIWNWTDPFCFRVVSPIQ